MTPKEFLQSKPKFPDPNGYFSGKDLFYRIQSFVKKRNGLGSSVVTMGASGGASIALWLTYHDSTINRSHERLITRTVSFSPILSPQRSFRVLDLLRTRAQPVVGDQGLTSFWSLVSGAIQYPNYQSILSLLKEDIEVEKRARLIHLFDNEFTVVDLKDTFETAHPEAIEDFKKASRSRHHSLIDHKWAYLDYGFHQAVSNTQVDEDELSKLLDAQEMIDAIKNPTWIVYSLDDPVLSIESRLDLGFPNESRLERARNTLPASTKSVKIFAPEGGGHMGYFLDTDWLQSLIEVSL